MSLLRLGRMLFCGSLVLGAGLLPVRGDEKDEKKEHTAVKAVSRGGPWEKRHEEFVALAKKGDIDVLFVGDALTDEWRKDYDEKTTRGGKAVWDKEFAPLKAANFGIGGDPAPSTSCGGCRTASWTASGPRSPC